MALAWLPNIPCANDCDDATTTLNDEWRDDSDGGRFGGSHKTYVREYAHDEAGHQDARQGLIRHKLHLFLFIFIPSPHHQETFS